MVSTAGYLALLCAVAVERLVELRRSSTNARRLKAGGAVEHGRAHYPAMVALHAAFLPACAVERLLLARRAPAPIAWAALAGFVLAQALRFWVQRTLGERWTTRIFVDEKLEPITSGPYRFLRHPNYVAVAVELLCIPLVGGCVWTAAVFSAANAALLAVRVRAEERAMGETYARAFAGLHAFRPRLRRGD
jgi:methyltransferase